MYVLDTNTLNATLVVESFNEAKRRFVSGWQYTTRIMG